VPEADPDAVPEKLYCNLLPVDALPHYVYIAPIAKALRRLKANGEEALPTKRQLIEVIRAQQLEGSVEQRFMPAFRVVGDEVISFHDMESSDNPLAGIVESDGVDDVPVKVSVKDFIHEEEIAEAEETALEVQTETEDLDGWESSGEEQLFEDEFDEDSDNDES
jgi:hypothetical protein